MNEEYSYVARTSDGKLVKGSIWVTDEEMGLKRLYNQGLSIVKFQKLHVKKSSTRTSWDNKDIISFFHQLYVLIRAGFSILDAIDFYSSNSKNKKITQLIYRIAEDIRNGKSFYDALKSVNMPPLVLQWVYIAEQSSNLEETCLEISNYYKNKEDLKKKIKKVFAYPVFMLILSLVLFIFTTIFFIPQFYPIYAGFGMEPPALVVTLVGIGLFLQLYGFYILVSTLVIVLVIIRMREKFFSKLHKHLKKMSLLKYIYQTQIFMLFSTMLKCGVDIFQSIEFMIKASSSEEEKKIYMDWIDKLRQGLPLSSVLAGASFEPIYVQMIKVGENSGQLDEMFAKAVEHGDEQVQESITKLLAVVQPILMLVMGSIIGMMVYTIMMPISEMLKGI